MNDVDNLIYDVMFIYLDSLYTGITIKGVKISMSDLIANYRESADLLEEVCQEIKKILRDRLGEINV